MIKIRWLHFLFKINNKLFDRYLKKGNNEKFKKHFRKCVTIRNRIEEIIKNNNDK